MNLDTESKAINIDTRKKVKKTFRPDFLNKIFLFLDENGIISGEFGFITGDGTYHESVYATDENGNFKLISSRSSFRIGKRRSFRDNVNIFSRISISNILSHDIHCFSLSQNQIKTRRHICWPYK